MIGEALILGTSLLGCVGCWTAVARHRISAELQKHKITTDYESIKPVPAIRCSNWYASCVP